MLARHESQVYEWLPYAEGASEEVPDDPDARFDRLRDGGLPHGERTADVADRFRARLVDRYGVRGQDVEYAEAFEVSEYGRPLTDDAADRLFPF